MVNVGGRSKGCQTCRKRRVKCDERKPFCFRCEKAGFVCGGYVKITKFLNTSSASFQPELLNERPSQRPNWKLAARSVVPNELSLRAFKDDMCLSFVFENIVWRSYGTPWLEQAASGKVDSLSLQCCHALAKANFGKYYHQSDIELAGRVQYGRNLTTLAPQLSCTKTGGLEKYILPVLIMLLYSTLAVDQAGSVSHARGLVQLLLICGPLSFQTPHLRSVFESCRASVITMHLIVKKRTFLELDAWQQIPWSSDPGCKSLQNHITDILATVPGLLEDAEAYDPSSSFESLKPLVDRIRTQLSRLFRIRWQWEVANGLSVWEAERPSSAGATAHRRHRGYEKELWFQNSLQSTEIMQYNATLLWLLSLLWRLDDQSVPIIVNSLAKCSRPLSAPLHSPLYRPGETYALRAPAVEICRCYEYHLLHGEGGKTSSLFYLLPIALAGIILKDEPVYSVWIRDMLNTSPATSGYGTDQSNTYGFRFYITPDSLRLQQ